MISLSVLGRFRWFGMLGCLVRMALFGVVGLSGDRRMRLVMDRGRVCNRSFADRRRPNQRYTSHRQFRHKLIFGGESPGL